MAVPATPAQAWEDYLFLTREMDKFLTSQDFDMFTELAGQREKLQAIIEEMASRDYLRTPRGQEIAAAVRKQDKAMQDRLLLLINKTRQDRTVTQAYDLYGAAMKLGSRMDSSR